MGAWTLQPNGEKRHITQTDRIGPFLQGAVKVIEGRGYLDDGQVGFNALGIVSYDPARRAYTLRSYALGHSEGGTLHEVGDRIVADRDPLRIFEMTLRRVGDTDWPAANAIPPR